MNQQQLLLKVLDIPEELWSLFLLSREDVDLRTLVSPLPTIPVYKHMFILSMALPAIILIVAQRSPPRVPGDPSLLLKLSQG